MVDIEVVDVIRQWTYEMDSLIAVEVHVGDGTTVVATVRIVPEFDREGEFVGADAEPIKALSYIFGDTEHDASDPTVDPFTSALIRHSIVLQEYARNLYESDAYREHVINCMV